MMTTIETRPASSGSGDGPSADAFAERLFGAVLGAQLVQAAYLGDRLGYYRALAGGEALTSSELATRTGTAERYAREWLEHQAVTAVLSVDDVAAASGARRFTLPAAAAEVLTEQLSPRHMMPVARMVAGVGRHLDALAGAFRSGGGVSWEQLGADAWQSQAAFNRPLFLGPLAREYLPSVPDLDARLRAGGRVADIGCGVGWSSIGIALAYPDASVDGFDVDVPSLEAARRNAVEAGVADRVRFHLADAAQVRGSYGSFDVVTAFECIHDLPHPVEVLAAMRELAEPDGTVLVMDERAAESFTAPGDEIEQVLYGFSITCCLPDGMSHPRSAGTGTVMRPDTLRRYAVEAGFNGLEVLAIEDDFFRFYRLT
jgi:SAM-dependent methyltransferase